MQKIGNKLTYWDDNHLNREGSIFIAKPLMEWMSHNFIFDNSFR